MQHSPFEAFHGMQMPGEAKHFLESAAVPSNDSKPDVESCRFPLSLGQAKLETDRQGELCTVYDVVYNDQAMAQAKAFRCVPQAELCLIYAHKATCALLSFCQQSDVAVHIAVIMHKYTYARLFSADTSKRS